MKRIKVKIFGLSRKLFRLNEFGIELKESITVAELIEILLQKFGDRVREGFFDEERGMFLNGNNVSHHNRLGTFIDNGDVIAIFRVPSI